MKPQAVRLLDVFVLGPFMVWAAGQLRGWPGDAMRVAGYLTIAYNAHNYAREAGHGNL